MEIKHSVIIIAYNVEKYIAEAIDSCLNQSVKPYEIIIGENCSTDNTKKIIQEYEKKYPDIIKVIYHKKNLGEYGNRNYIKKNIRLEGDIVHLLDGDDLFKQGMFEAMNRIVYENNINLKNEQFIIMSNVANLYLNGAEKIMSNNYKYKNFNNFMRLRIRNILGSRMTGMSISVYQLAPLWKSELGMWADYQHSIGLYSNVNHIYFIDEVYPIYRIGSGITSNLKNEDIDSSYKSLSNSKNKKELLKISYLTVVKNLYLSKIKNKSFLDNIYLKKEIYKTEYLLSKKKLLHFIVFKFLDFPLSMKYDGLYKYLKEFDIFLSDKMKLQIKNKLKGN